MIYMIFMIYMIIYHDHDEYATLSDAPVWDKATAWDSCCCWRVRANCCFGHNYNASLLRLT